jgi:hypothetical protein
MATPGFSLKMQFQSKKVSSNNRGFHQAGWLQINPCSLETFGILPFCPAASNKKLCG